VVFTKIVCRPDGACYHMFHGGNEVAHRVTKLLCKALDLVSFRKELDIHLEDQQLEQDTHAITKLSMWGQPPRITLLPSALALDDDQLGITLTHELFHCRQGAWKVFWQNLLWAVLRRSGFPPIEVEAYEAVNLWPPKETP